MQWTQVYFPLGNLYLSALAAALPVIVLLGALAFFHVQAHVAALLGLASALAIALGLYHMPAPLAFAAAINGAAYGLFPIGWIVLTAIFAYDISVHTGKFDIVKRVIAHLASDRRIQLLLISFSFGAFIEGASGFGTPIAICAAMLIGLGFKPLPAAGLSLLGNTAPVAFGALGTPLIALARVTQLPLDQLSAMVGRQLPFFAAVVPFWMVWALSDWESMLAVWPACLVAGISFAIPQFLVSNFHGPWLVDVVAALVSIVCTAGLLRFWQPKTVWRFPGEESHDRGAAAVRPSSSEALVAFMPWLLLSLFVFLWGLPQVKAFLDGLHVIKISVPHLDKLVLRAPPVVSAAKPEEAVFIFNYLSATGTGLLLSAILSGTLLGVKPGTLVRIFLGTLHRMRFSLLTIAAMLALGFTTRFAGSDATMGLAFASTGKMFAFFSPILGWLGVALTGSDTASNVLFGNLQQITAQQVGMSPLLAAASNSSGGVMGKMIDAQSIVVAGVATGQKGGEGEILRYVFKHSIVLAVLVGLLVLLQAYVLPGMIP